MTVGIYIIIILILGYASVYIRERWLRTKWIKPLTWIGIFIHESFHALFCVFTGGRVTGFRVTSTDGYVTHYRPKVPIIGPMLTAMGPLIGGLIVIGVLNRFWLRVSLEITSSNIWENFYKVVSSLDFLSWQTWVLLVIFLNIGVMLGPSVADLKNIWPIVVLSFFIKSEALAQVFALVIAIIIINIYLFLIIELIKLLFKNENRPHYIE